MAKEKKSVWERNFAEDPVLAEKTAGYFVPRIRVTRNNRQALEETWWRFFNMWNVEKDGYHSYNGRAQLYIPEVRKNVEAQARQLTKSAFPGEDTFDVSPGLTGTRRGAESWRSVQKWSMDNCQLPLSYFVAMRQEVLLGTTPIYLPWRKVSRHQFRSRRKGKDIVQTRQEIELFNGPDFIVRDIFRWYTFNPKKSDLSDGCFEIMPCSPFELQAMRRKGILANYDKIVAGASNAYLNEEMARDVMRAESLGIQIQFNQAYAGEAVIRKGEDENKEADTSFMRTRIFADMIFPEACDADDDPEVPIPMMIDIYGNEICGLIQRNPFFHQSPPYVVGRYIRENADEFYGQGLPWAIQYMQYEMNSKAEQGMDSATLSLNPIAIIDPGLAGDAQFDFEPGAKWFANPTGVKLTSIPDVTPIAHQAIQNLKAMMQDYSDRSPALPPQLLGKSRSATQSEIVSESLSVDNWLFQLQNEKLILEPVLEQWESLTDQNMDDKMLVMILGRRAGDLRRTLLSRSDLIGKYAYRWKGASVASGKQIIGRQMLDALKVLSLIPPPQLQNLNFNYGEFFKILWTDIWALPDADKILGVPEEMVAQDAEAENEMVTMGLELEVLPMDDDDGHIQSHDTFIPKLKSDIEKQIMATHILEHQAQKQRKQLVQQQMQQQQQMQMMMAMQQAQGGKQRSPGSGNRAQLSPNGSAGDMASGNRP